MKSGHINQYTNLSQFNNLKDFNNNIEQWMIDIKDQFTKGELIGLKRLIRYSAKIPGVCNAKIQTLVSACSDMGGISRRTFERMLSRAKSLGLLKVVNTYKENGKQGHNVYVFNQYTQSDLHNDNLKTDKDSISQSNDVPNPVDIVAPIETIDPSETSNISNERNDTLDASFTSNRVPKEFTSLAATYYSCPKTIEEFYLIVKQVTRYYLHYTEQDKLELAIECFKQLIRNIKLGNRKIHNLFGYYNRIVHGVLDKRYFEELYEEIG